MDNTNNQLGLLDILTIISFALQVQNQGNIINIKDVQSEVDRAIDKLNEHLEVQDDKINKIMEALNVENY